MLIYPFQYLIAYFVATAFDEITLYTYIDNILIIVERLGLVLILS